MNVAMCYASSKEVDEDNFHEQLGNTLEQHGRDNSRYEEIIG